MDGKSKNNESEIVAQFRIVDTPTSTDIPTAQEAFLDDYNSCPLCGSELVFTHVTQFVEQFVKEEACCTGCNILVKDNSHSLQ